MRPEQDITLEDIVDAHLWYVDRSSAVRRRRRYSFLVSLGLVTVIPLLLLPRPLEFRIAVGLLSGAAFVILHLLTSGRSRRKQMRKYLRDQIGSDGPYPFRVSLEDDRIAAELNGISMNYPYDRVRSIDEAPQGTGICVDGGGLVFIGDDLFHSPAEREAFLNILRERAAPHGAPG